VAGVDLRWAGHAPLYAACNRRSWQSYRRGEHADSDVGDTDPSSRAVHAGWALGGDSSADRRSAGRSRTLCLTVLTYAAFTGYRFLAQTWWHLLIFRSWRVGIGRRMGSRGRSLLSETWPHNGGHGVAAVLQSGVNVGIVCACLANYLLASAPLNYLFSWASCGVAGAVIRRAVPETEEWQAAKASAHHQSRA